MATRRSTGREPNTGPDTDGAAGTGLHTDMDILLDTPARLLATGWAAAFGVVHVIWATGSPVGLGPEAGAGMSGWFLVYDVAVAVGCVIGAAIAWAGRPRWILWTVAVLLLLRGGLGVAQAAFATSSGDGLGTTFWVEPYFLLGGVAFALAGRFAHRRASVYPAANALTRVESGPGSRSPRSRTRAPRT